MSWLALAAIIVIILAILIAVAYFRGLRSDRAQDSNLSAVNNDRVERTTPSSQLQDTIDNDSDSWSSDDGSSDDDEYCRCGSPGDACTWK